MMSRRVLFTSSALLCLFIWSTAGAQSPSALYTWDNTGNAQPNIESWKYNFGANTVLLDNAIPGELRIIETGGTGQDVAISDGSNRVRESAVSGSGGTDVTGLDWLEFDLGHTGAGNIDVQFFVQASIGFNYVALGPDLAVTPGVNTYQVSLSGLTPAQAVYLRTIGFNARSHAGNGDVAWTLREVRAGGTPLEVRDLITHDAGTPDGGRQGAIVNFDRLAVQGNVVNGTDNGQNQTGLSWNPAGSLQWTDLGGQAGAAIIWGNGTGWQNATNPSTTNGNTFNNRESDLSNYRQMIVRMSATDPQNGGGTLQVQGFFQRNNFSFQSAEGGAGKNLPIDGQFHDVVYSLAGLSLMNAVDATGLNLFGHSQDLIINVDNIRFITPEPASVTLVGIAMIGALGMVRRKRRS